MIVKVTAYLCKDSEVDTLRGLLRKDSTKYMTISAPAKDLKENLVCVVDKEHYKQACK